MATLSQDFINGTYLNEEVFAKLKDAKIIRMGWIANSEITAMGVDYEMDGQIRRCAFIEDNGCLIVLQDAKLQLPEVPMFIRNIKQYRNDIKAIRVTSENLIFYRYDRYPLFISKISEVCTITGIHVFFFYGKNEMHTEFSPLYKELMSLVDKVIQTERKE